VRLGALLLPNVGWPELARRAQEVEALGFDAIWLDDHLAHPADPDGPWLESFAALAALAQVTSRVTLGPLVANTILRPAATLRRQALSLDELSGGRLDLGVGAGYAASDHAGETPWPPDERLRRFAAAVELVRPAVRRLTVAAHEPGALAVAARHADTWVSYGGFGLSAGELLTLTRERAARLDELAARPIRKRLLAGSAALTPELWSSLDAFDEFAGRCGEIGVDELALHWPPQATNPRADPRVVDAVVARL
jgi:alkanesulfonate monooxygenase SsuD/methylene tetrahydromethanopterin reductase-like flavin-dependent oxidoreductase (luciferase family)